MLAALRRYQDERGSVRGKPVLEAILEKQARCELQAVSSERSDDAATFALVAGSGRKRQKLPRKKSTHLAAAKKPANGHSPKLGAEVCAKGHTEEEGIASEKSSSPRKRRAEASDISPRSNGSDSLPYPNKGLRRELTKDQLRDIKHQAEEESLKAFKASTERIEAAKKQGKTLQLGPFADVPAAYIPRGVPGGKLELDDEFGNFAVST